MDINSKLKIANMLVSIDDAIGQSNGIADLLGKVIASAIGSFFDAPIEIDKKLDSEASEVE